MVRAPAVAGRFYPDNPEELGEMVTGFLPSPLPDSPEQVVAMMAPHAGLIYSGRVAGATYGTVAVPRRILLMGPNHTGLGAPLSLWDQGSWAMPGGVTEVDEEFCGILRRNCPVLLSDRAAHLREHCLEVQLPFLRARHPDFRIAPIVVGTSRLDDLRELGRGVAASVAESPEPVLIVISSDMTHYEPAAEAAAKDRLAVRQLEGLDPEGLHRTVRQVGISMCGYAPAVAGLFAARDLGARSGRLVLYAHSGEVSGDNDAVVGYAGMVFS